MVETVKRFRETGAMVVLGASVVYILMSLVRLTWLLLHDHTSLPEAAHVIGGSSLSVVMALAVVAVVLSCVLVRPATRRAADLVRAGAWVLTTAAALEGLFLLLGLFSHAVGLFGALLEVVGGLLEIGVKAAAATVLWRVARSAPEPAVEAAPSRAAAPAAPATTVPAEQQASWAPDQAAGAVWTRAGDAATGAAASTWGVPGEASHGWDAATAPALEAPRASGPWATAGQLASGSAAGASRGPEDSVAPDAPAAGTWDAPGATTGNGPVQWTPAPRGE